MLQHIFRVGKEHRITLKKDIQLVFGADFQARYLAISNLTNINYYRLDSISDQGLISQKSHYSRSEPESQFFSTTKGWQYGVGLSGGFLLPGAKRWWLNANFRVNSFYGRLYDTNQNIYTSAIDRVDYLQISLETGCIISEITLFYRF
jgi:hypothetical protein